MKMDAISDPAGVLIGIGCLLAFAASFYWFRVARGGAASSELVKGRATRSLAPAAAFTGLAMCIAATGYLLGRVVG